MQLSHISQTKLFNSSRFIWVNDEAKKRNQFVLFKREFELSVKPEQFPFYVFADTRYRLRVNGKFVAAGPGRFVTQFPEYDTHDLAALLKIGKNTIAVEVNYFGASSFQSMPDGEPGFIAAGGNDVIDLATPGDWKALRLAAWRWDAPLFSFAQNPVEICDTRLLESGKSVPIIECSGSAAPWGEVKPYSGIPIPFFVLRPKKIVLAGALVDVERRYGFVAHNVAAAKGEGRNTKEKQHTAFATWIHSPNTQSLTCSAFWSEMELNGNPVTLDVDTPYGNHGHVELELREGWNLLTGILEILTEFWTYSLGIPLDAEITLHGIKDAGCSMPFSLGPVGNKECLTLPSEDDNAAPAGWTLHDGNPERLTPARMMAWDHPAEGAPCDKPFEGLADVATVEANSASWAFSFAGEFLGHIVLEVDAPAGSILDVACDDWQHENGGVALYRSNPFTDAADRFILRGGRQIVELFHPRGGKLIQVTLRSATGNAPLTLHDIFVRSRQTLGTDHSQFSCDNPVLEWAWPVSLRTLLVSTDESYSDCPWRERGSYIGDGYVNIHLNVLLSNDMRTAERTLRIFGQAKLPNGQLACCSPSWLRKPHEDFTLIWLLSMHDTWQYSGDTRLLEEMWPEVQGIWKSNGWEKHESGLWNTNDNRMFIDWGVLKEERTGDANAVINMFRVAAAHACAEMAEALGKHDEAREFERHAAETKEAICSVLWDENEGRFLASVGATSTAVHANTLALAFKVGTPEMRQRVLNYLEPKLLNNLAFGLREGQGTGYLELYFLHYALPALVEHGRVDIAEKMIEDHYGYLMRLGDDTLPECFSRVERSVGSRCHSWSGAAAIHAARYVLGIRMDGSGNPDALVFDPIVHGIRRASGRICHRKGWIDVAWKMRDDGSIEHEISVPEGVVITPSHMLV